MPTYYEGNPIAEIKAQLSQEDFVNGYMLKEKTTGRLKGTYWYGALFLVLSVLSDFSAINEVTVFGMVSKWLICIALIFAAFYCAVIRVMKTKKEGIAIYNSSSLLKEKFTLKAYRDSFYMENEYEQFSGYWTDIAAGLETKERIIIVSEWFARPVVIPKTEENREQTEALSRHLQNTLISKYKVRQQ